MKGLIYLNLHAEAYYSGAEYDETIFITPEDYRKYFCNGDKTVDAFKHASENWHCKEISVGELDGKHSDVHGDVYVDFFEEENINSLKEESEVYIGIHSIMAQTESENISANVKWGIGKRMENGTYHSNMNMYGNRRDKFTKEVRIVPEEVEVVRTIYRFF